MNESVLLVEEEKKVVTLTLNRPEVMNSSNRFASNRMFA